MRGAARAQSARVCALPRQPHPRLRPAFFPAAPRLISPVGESTVGEFRHRGLFLFAEGGGKFAARARRRLRIGAAPRFDEITWREREIVDIGGIRRKLHSGAAASARRRLPEFFGMAGALLIFRGVEF